MSLTVYLIVSAITYFVIMVAAFTYEATRREFILNEGIIPAALASAALSLVWFMVIPIATLVGLAYAVAKLLIFCREKWRNK